MDTDHRAIVAGDVVLRQRRHHARKTPRTYALAYHNRPRTLADAAIRWLLPWKMRDYPGISAGIREVLGGLGSDSLLKNLRRGERRMQPWLAERLLAEVDRRCAEGEAIAEELRRYMAEFKPFDRSNAFRKINEETRLSIRFRG